MFWFFIDQPCVDTDLHPFLPVCGRGTGSSQQARPTSCHAAWAWGTRTLCYYANQDFPFGIFPRKSCTRLHGKAESYNQAPLWLCKGPLAAHTLCDSSLLDHLGYRITVTWTDIRVHYYLCRINILKHTQRKQTGDAPWKQITDVYYDRTEPTHLGYDSIQKTLGYILIPYVTGFTGVWNLNPVWLFSSIYLPDLPSTPQEFQMELHGFERNLLPSEDMLSPARTPQKATTPPLILTQAFNCRASCDMV